MKYKGIYRLRTPIDKSTNSFPREHNGQFADNDIYIDCQNRIQIFSYGHGVLEAYIPSLQLGRTILKSIYHDIINKENTETKTNTYDVTRKIRGREETVHVTKETITIIDEKLYEDEISSSDIIFHIEETDSEVLFRFKANDVELLEKYLKPRTNGANISPFSTKNLPKQKYIIPDEDLDTYKKIVKKIGKERIIELTHMTNKFLKSLSTKPNTWDNIRADMQLKGLKGKEYIHSIGKWENYIKYLKNQINI